MTCVAIVGTSHVAALKQGWAQAAPRWPGVSARFFGVLGRQFARLRLDRDLRLGAGDRPKFAGSIARINGTDHIELGGADAVLRVGLDNRRLALLRILGDMDVDGLRETGAPRRMTLPAFRAIAAALAEESVPAKAWRGWSGPRLFVALTPMPTPERLADQKNRIDPAGRIAADPAGVRAAVEIFDDAFEAALAPHGVSLLRQPAETLGPDGFTLPSFSRGSRRIANDAPHEDGDHLHMNGDYGALCLDAFLAALSAQSADAPVASAAR